MDVGNIENATAKSPELTNLSSSSVPRMPPTKETRSFVRGSSIPSIGPNTFCCKMLTSRRSIGSGSRMFTLRLRPKPVNSTQEHMALLERIRAGDAPGAIDVNRAHRARATRELVTIFERYRLQQL